MRQLRDKLEEFRILPVFAVTKRTYDEYVVNIFTDINFYVLNCKKESKFDYVFDPDYFGCYLLYLGQKLQSSLVGTGSLLGELSSNSSNIIEIIKNSYQVIFLHSNIHSK